MQPSPTGCSSVPAIVRVLSVIAAPCAEAAGEVQPPLEPRERVLRPVVERVLLAAELVGRAAVAGGVLVDVGAAPLRLVLRQRLAHLEELLLELARDIGLGLKARVRLDRTHQDRKSVV